MLCRILQRNLDAPAELKPTEKTMNMIIEEHQYANSEDKRMHTRLESFSTFKHQFIPSILTEENKLVKGLDT